MKSAWRVGGGMAIVLCLLQAVQAAPPWQRISLFKKVDADPTKSYAFGEKNGPWTIMAATFSGEGAEDQARELVLELRAKHKMSAYTHEVQFDYRNQAQGHGRDQFGGARRMKYQIEQIHEIAVLVGDYSAVDDPAAQKTLKKLKYLQPDCLDLEKRIQEGKQENRSLAAFRMAQRVVQEMAGSDKRERGPMGHAFITTNPLLPDEYFAPKGVDKLVLSMNEDVEHSLLNCPGRFTCVVATFDGNVLIDQEKIKEIEDGKRMPSKLAEAAAQAHKLTSALRSKGVEAYEFHDRYCSLVSVGSFDYVGTPRADGKQEINPQIHAVIQTYGAQAAHVPGQSSGYQPKSLKGIPFDVTPRAVEVPRRAVSADNERPLLDLRSLD